MAASILIFLCFFALCVNSQPHNNPFDQFLYSTSFSADDDTSHLQPNFALVRPYFTNDVPFPNPFAAAPWSSPATENLLAPPGFLVGVEDDATELFLRATEEQLAPPPAPALDEMLAPAPSQEDLLTCTFPSKFFADGLSNDVFLAPSPSPVPLPMTSPSPWPLALPSPSPWPLALPSPSPWSLPLPMPSPSPWHLDVEYKNPWRYRGMAH